MIEPAPGWVAGGLGLLAVAGAVGLFAIEQLARPRGVPPSRRPVSVIAAAASLWLWVFAFLVLALGRGLMAALTGLGLLGALVVVNNTKEALLREPLLFDDYDYLLDTLRHPRLFLPFLGTRRALGGLAAVGGLLPVAWWLEPAWAWSPSGVTVAVVMLLVGTAGMVRQAMVAGEAAVATPRSMMRRAGLFAFLVAGLRRPWMRGRAPQSSQRAAEWRDWPGLVRALPEGAALPHLVAVQSESFMDPRGRIPGVRADLLRHFDALAGQGTSGALRVPAFGANTVRSEHAFLSGMGPAELGGRRFNPYRYVHAGQLDRTFVQALKRAGYRTLCVHPYHAGFYVRHRVMPRLGFDEFVDISAFPAPAERETTSVYVSDAVLGDWVAQCLAHTRTPLFIFVITMENHGPLHLESPFAGEALQYLEDDVVPSTPDEVTVYLRHLRHADQMLEGLSVALNQAERGGVLCWYGDHPPILPGVWSVTGHPGRWTDYLIWSSRSSEHGRSGGPGPLPGLRLHQLAACFLRYASGMGG